MTNINPARRPWMVLLALLASGALLLSAAPAATAEEHLEHEVGELRVLDDRDDDVHDPAVSCGFWVAGIDMPAENGTLVIKTVPGGTAVLNDTWEANETGHFVNGPYGLEPDSYVVEAFYHYEGLLEPNGTRPAAPPVEFMVVECPEEPEPACPTDLQAEALGNGDVRLTFTPAEGADATLVYRSVGDGDAERIAVLDGDATEFVDGDTEPGTTYTYEVRHAFGEEETTGCPTVEVTAIPVFPTVVGALAASTVGVLAYAGARRRV